MHLVDSITAPAIGMKMDNGMDLCPTGFLLYESWRRARDAYLDSKESTAVNKRPLDLTRFPEFLWDQAREGFSAQSGFLHRR